MMTLRTKSLGDSTAERLGWNPEISVSEETQQSSGWGGTPELNL